MQIKNLRPGKSRALPKTQARRAKGYANNFLNGETQNGATDTKTSIGTSSIIEEQATLNPVNCYCRNALAHPRRDGGTGRRSGLKIRRA
jgi:hypothetical protein